MWLIIFLISSCLGFQWTYAEEAPVPCTFFTLEALQNETEIEIPDGALIQIRGFLYQIDDSHSILAAEPNLKSCCVGSTSKRHKQLLIDGDVQAAIGNKTPVTLQGNLLVNFNDPLPFKLKGAVIVAEKEQSYGVIVVLLIFAVVAAFAVARNFLHR